MKLVGYANTAPQIVKRKLRRNSHFKDMSSVIVDDPESFYDADIFLFFTMRNFAIYAQKNVKYSFTGKYVFIFDSPLVLYNYNIFNVDYEINAKYEFLYKKYDKSVYKKMLALPEVTTAGLWKDKRNFITDLVVAKSTGHFLSLYNKLMYSTPNVEIRAALKLAMLSYLFSNKSLERFNRDVGVYIKRKGTKLDLIRKEVSDYLSDSKFHDICVRITKDAKTTPIEDYKKYTEGTEVDTYEVRYLHKAYLALK